MEIRPKSDGQILQELRDEYAQAQLLVELQRVKHMEATKLVAREAQSLSDMRAERDMRSRLFMEAWAKFKKREPLEERE